MRFYRALLYLYPKSFRLEYGAEILSVIAERRVLAGPGGRLALAAETVVDTMTNALRIHVDILLQDLRYTVRTLRRSPALRSPPSCSPHSVSARRRLPSQWRITCCYGRCRFATRTG